MAPTLEQMARAWRARQAQVRTDAETRRARLRAQLPAARALLRQRYGARRAVLFGSLAEGNRSHPGSDVDLAVEGLPPAAQFEALADLMALFCAPVDLVLLEQASDSLRARVAAEGEPL